MVAISAVPCDWLFQLYIVIGCFGCIVRLAISAVPCDWLFQLYLVIGYYFEVVSGKEYNISWTMPHCVLTLRLTAVAFDLYDGQKVSPFGRVQHGVGVGGEVSGWVGVLCFVFCLFVC